MFFSIYSLMQQISNHLYIANKSNDIDNKRYLHEAFFCMIDKYTDIIGVTILEKF